MGGLMLYSKTDLHSSPAFDASHFSGPLNRRSKPIAIFLKPAAFPSAFLFLLVDAISANFFFLFSPRAASSSPFPNLP